MKLKHFADTIKYTKNFTVLNRFLFYLTRAETVTNRLNIKALICNVLIS